VAPGVVGDLHVRGAGGILGNHLVDVVAVDREVVEVGEQPEVVGPVSARTRSITTTPGPR
jgi:hypothetical protein